MGKTRDKQREKVETKMVTDEVIADVIQLARLDPSDPTMAEQKEHLKRILGHFRILSQMEVEGLNPTIMINPTPILLREDKVGESLERTDALQNAQLKTGELFQAPKILGGEESDYS